jgi:hypothetical protein
MTAKAFAFCACGIDLDSLRVIACSGGASAGVTVAVHRRAGPVSPREPERRLRSRD